jgi:class 3 adenylate cyclase
MTTKFFFAAAFGWFIVFLLARLLFRADRESRNPLDWTAVDRCLLMIAVFFAIGSTLSFVFGVIWLNPGRLPYINWAFVPPLLNIWRSVGLVWFFVLMIGLWLRRRDRESNLFTHFVVQFSAVHTALFCYMWGTVSEISPWLFGMALASFILILFRTAVALPWIPTFLAMIAASQVGVWLDLIPYGPVFSTLPFAEGKPHGLYAIITLCWAALIFSIMLLLITYVVVRWRDREARLEEMTTLLKKMFGRYLSEEVMNTIIERPDSIKLGGEKRKVTMMMTDLRGFTQLSERLDPEKVMALLNRYFDVMMRICKKYHGTINDIFGDALLVTFGAPQEMEDHAQAAVACAIEMQNAMKVVNEENVHRGLPKLDMGIGLNTADVVVGNIGTEERAKFGVVGSGVNMTSRIESYTVGGQILISESVRQEAGEVLRIDGQLDVHPKGAETPLTICDVGGISGNYNLTLEEKDLKLVILSRRILLEYRMLEGKHEGKVELRGFIVKLSKKGAEIDMEGPVELMTNLKMRLGEVDEMLATKDFYGKVIERSGENGHIYTVRFTSLPIEIGAYFQAHRQYASKPGPE